MNCQLSHCAWNITYGAITKFHTMYVCMYVFLYACMYVCMYVGMYVCMYAPIGMWSYIGEIFEISHHLQESGFSEWNFQ